MSGRRWSRVRLGIDVHGFGFKVRGWWGYLSLYLDDLKSTTSYGEHGIAGRFAYYGVALHEQA